MLTIVLPTRNEAAIIRATLERLIAFLRANIRADWRIIVADNASTDATRDIVREIARREPRVSLFEIEEAGKGRAVLTAWRAAFASSTRRTAGSALELTALHEENVGAACHGRPGGDSTPPLRGADLIAPRQTFAFMDADLATDLRHLPELVEAVRNGADIAIGSRHLPASRTERGTFRRTASWCYRQLLRRIFGLTASDPPCGFKAVSARVVRDIVPHVRDVQWFFDTELLIRAQRAGLRVAEVPVTWYEPRRGSSMRKVAHMIVGDLRAMWRLKRELGKM